MMRLPAGSRLNGRTGPTAAAIGLVAPFDGIVSASLVSVGELVGAASPTRLATIVQLDPAHVNFNVNEQEVLLIRCWTSGHLQSG